MKYDIVIQQLDDDELYSPSTVAAFAERCGLLESVDPDGIRQDKQRIRIALGRFSNNHQFPNDGDGMVHVKGQAPTPGWFGWRWKAAARA